MLILNFILTVSLLSLDFEALRSIYVLSDKIEPDTHLIFAVTTPKSKFCHWCFCFTIDSYLISHFIVVLRIKGYTIRLAPIREHTPQTSL